MSVILQLKDLGLAGVLAFSAMGSAYGAGVAAMSAIGAWKKCFIQNRPAPFILIAFVGAPLTQTVYGMIIMNRIAEIVLKGEFLWSIGIFSGIAMGLSALWQGKAAACACDAFGENQKGFNNYIIALGIIETVALFVMAFTLGVLGKFK